MERYACHLELTFERDWELVRRPPAFTHYNIQPRLQVPIVRLDANGGREAVMARWGLLAPGQSPRRPGRPRLQVTHLARTPWNDLAVNRERRCILPALGWYLLPPLMNEPWFVHLRHQRLFGIAGIWHRHEDALSSTGLLTAAAVTVSPGRDLIDLQGNRRQMPAALLPEAFRQWLELPLAQAQELLRPPPPGELQGFRVGPAVLNPANTGPECMAPAQSARPAGS